MPKYSVVLHRDGPALWPDHKPLAEILDLKEVTPEMVWSTTYQGAASPPGGVIFRRDWWKGKNRFDIREAGLRNAAIARYISLDTAKKEDERADPSAMVVGELSPDYRLYIRQVYAERLDFPDLADWTLGAVHSFGADGKLRGIVVEDKSSGTSLLQTLRKIVDPSVAERLVPFLPTTDKSTRARQASAWAANGSVLLPHPDPSAPWLFDFEDELFGFPQMAHDDRVDAFSQLIIYLENLLEQGLHARKGMMNHVTD